MSLDKSHPELFFKKLRKYSENCDRKIKYFLVGEYGEKRNRPHYHIILFNTAIETIQRAWDKGTVHYGDVKGASIGYTLKYISKPRSVPAFEGDDRLCEFARMSKGLGADYLTEGMVKWHLADPEKRMYITNPDQCKIGMPRYYKDKIYEKNQLKLIQERVRNEMTEKYDKEIKETENFFRDKYQADAQAFRKMKLDSKRNKSL